VNLYRRWGKRTLDVAASAALLILLAPVLAFLALVVAATIGRPILFRQERPGLHGRPFTLLKFRTMTDARDGEGNWLPDGQRLTRVGQTLRRWSLDELPEFWNVLRGDMSLVGPRPLLMQYLPRYTPEQARRQEVRPGITGLAQVDGRNELPWDEKFRLDVTYVDSLALALDVRILSRTVRTVLTHEGVSGPGCATMAEFMGADSARAPGGQAPAAGSTPAPAGDEESR